LNKGGELASWLGFLDNLRGFGSLSIRSTPMWITSPFLVVPVIVVVFFSCIFFATSSKEDGHESH